MRQCWLLHTQVLPHPKPWLLRSVRVAVHMRRGDITQNVHHLNRLLPLRYYVNLLQQLTKVKSAAAVSESLCAQQGTSGERAQDTTGAPPLKLQLNMLSDPVSAHLRAAAAAFYARTRPPRSWRAWAMTW